MYYPKTKTAVLNPELFKKPTAEYRGTPFWSWNTKLEKAEIERQIEVFKQMGFGGFNMHSRSGLDTPYLSDEFMQMVQAGVEKAKAESMLAWIYDEDRWPSGYAGGLVTESDDTYRMRYLMFTATPYTSEEIEHSETHPELLACYDVLLDHEGWMLEYGRVEPSAPGNGKRFYAYATMSAREPWHNNQSYIDTLNPEAVKRFLDVTHEKYNEWVGKDFGGAVPAVFTDEPMHAHRHGMASAFADDDPGLMPWTPGFPDSYRAQYGKDVLDTVPELFLDFRGKKSQARYFFNDHACELLASAFLDQYSQWCKAHGILLSGHVLAETCLYDQMSCTTETMRLYRAFDIPGIDVLNDQREFNTAKQVQSAARQYGREGILSELYGVTGWDNDFRGYKLQGDWQAAMGITIRVPHLSWLSMKGEGKRDFPASFNYQAPWYTQFPLVENHFARLNTALTRGTPLVKVGVIHPVESYWQAWGANAQTAGARTQMDADFANLTQWLMLGGIDFDFICESLLPSQCPEAANPFPVGEMRYETVVVPGCGTLRESTLQRLEAFRDLGGTVLFLGQAPDSMDGALSPRGAALAARCRLLPMNADALLNALEPVRMLDLRGSNGTRTPDLLHQIRKDGDGLWLFVCNAFNPKNKDSAQGHEVTIRIQGEFSPQLYNTENGAIIDMAAEYIGGHTLLRIAVHAHDSFLFRLENGKTNKKTAVKTPTEWAHETHYITRVPVTLREPNALLLDIAEYALDDGAFRPTEEILRIDNILRADLGYPPRTEANPQPWAMPPEKMDHTAKLRFTIESNIAVPAPLLAMEEPETALIWLNSESVKVEPTGWYVDKDIKTFALPALRPGANTLEIHLPFGRRANLEWCYLLGDFGVHVAGTQATLTAPVTNLAFGDITHQGLPFYTGNLTYHLQATGNRFALQCSRYRGAMLGVDVDGQRVGSIVYAPYSLEVNGLKDGAHTVDITLYNTRQNGFGHLHCADETFSWIGPGAWLTQDDQWSYEYVFKPAGILKSPVIRY